MLRKGRAGKNEGGGDESTQRGFYGAGQSSNNVIIASHPKVIHVQTNCHLIVKETWPITIKFSELKGQAISLVQSKLQLD